MQCTESDIKNCQLYVKLMISLYQNIKASGLAECLEQDTANLSQIFRIFPSFSGS